MLTKKKQSETMRVYIIKLVTVEYFNILMQMISTFQNNQRFLKIW